MSILRSRLLLCTSRLVSPRFRPRPCRSDHWIVRCSIGYRRSPGRSHSFCLDSEEGNMPAMAVGGLPPWIPSRAPRRGGGNSAHILGALRSKRLSRQKSNPRPQPFDSQFFVFVVVSNLSGTLSQKHPSGGGRSSDPHYQKLVHSPGASPLTRAAPRHTIPPVLRHGCKQTSQAGAIR